MAQKEKEEFVVADKRKFTSEGDLRTDVTETTREALLVTEPPAKEAPPEAKEAEIPEPPTAAEQNAQHLDYQAAGKKIDSLMDEAGAERPADMEINFERLIASLYMQTMAQLGMIREENTQPRPDIISARQTIDTIALLESKTKGNLTSRESSMLQNCLFELRMAFLEITTVLTKAPAAGDPSQKK